MANPIIVELIDGGSLMRVPVGDTFAVILPDDFALLMELGLSPRWYLSGGVVSATSIDPGGNIAVSRVLLDAGPGQTIWYRNKDRTDLRRDNLILLNEGRSTRRDRDLITPPLMRRQRPWKVVRVLEVA